MQETNSQRAMTGNRNMLTGNQIAGPSRSRQPPEPKKILEIAD
jgi:hypothetical protein